MKEKPILFSTTMVKAILDGRKSQTRRIIKPQPLLEKFAAFVGGDYNIPEMARFWTPDKSGNNEPIIEDVNCPYGKIGDILWVRESFSKIGDRYLYKENYLGVPKLEDVSFKPSIFMPKEACRIRLEITSIRVERVQDISEADAIAEGIIELLQSAVQLAQDGRQFYNYSKKPELFNEGLMAIGSYKSLWESINDKGSWDKNPWCWVIEFKRL